MITNAESGTNIHEIADGIFRINTPVSLPGGPGQFSFNQYLIIDEAPMLFHTGQRQLFPLVSEAIRAVLPIERLAFVGLSHYGVSAYAVVRRTREIGIRLSLGAHRATVLGMVLRQSMRLVAIGSAIGLVLGFGLGKAIAARFGVPSADIIIFAGVAALFAIVGFAACYVPARRAMRIRAIEALRYE